MRTHYQTKIRHKRIKRHKSPGDIQTEADHNALYIAQYDNVVSMGLGLDRWLGAYKPARSRHDNGSAPRKG